MSAHPDVLTAYRLRTVRVGLQATAATLAVLVAYPFVAGTEGMHLAVYAGVVGVAAVAAVVVGLLPWLRLFATRAGTVALYAWSVVDILLVTVAIGATGGTGSDLFIVYALTTVFFAASYPVRGLLGLLAFTCLCYLAVVLLVDPTPDAGAMFIRLTILAVIAFMASFLSGELLGQLREHRVARSQADRRALLIGVVASAARRISALDPRDVLANLMDATIELGLEVGNIALFDERLERYDVVHARGLPEDYTARSHSSDRGMPGLVLRERTTVVVDDYAELPGGLPVAQQLGVRGALATPIWTQGRLTGVLVAGMRTRGAFTPEEIEAFELLASLASRALENARRFADERKTVERLAELDRLKSDFVSNVSHELRTPLTVIGGLSQTLESRWTALTDEQRRGFIDRIDVNASSLNRILTGLLDVAHLGGRRALRVEAVDLGALADATAERVATLFAQHDLRVETGAGGAVVVVADPALLERVVENLLTNAAKHTPAGTRVVVSVRREAPEVVLEVSDDGPGIPAHELGRVGQRFFRGGEPNTRESRGLGLGLALASEILALHGTRLDVRSEPARGACFGFRLPAADHTAMVG